MKILFITEFFPSDKELKFTGGVEARTYYLAQKLSNKNTVSIVCRKSNQLKEVKKIANIAVYPCGPTTVKIEANFYSVFERIFFILSSFWQGLSLDFDIIEGSNFVTYIPAFLLGLFKRKPIISWWPDVLGKDWFKYFGVVGYYGYFIEKISLRLPWTKIIALSKSTKDKLIKTGIDSTKIEVVYGGVETKLKIKNKKLKIKKGKNIICISRLVKYKRVDDLIQAFSLIEDKYSDLRLTIVGQGPEEMKLKKLVIEKKLSNKVNFFNNLKREKLIKLLKQSYLFCLPSILEGFGLATIEAAALSVPYIVSDIEVNKEITHNGQGGLLFEKENIIDLKKKVEILLKQNTLYEFKKKQGLNLAKIYNWDKIAKQTRKVYDEVLR